MPRGTRAQALDLIFRSAVESGEGFRTAALGIPRFGKTYHLQEVVAEAIERQICRWALVHDVKKVEPQYEGTVRASIPDLLARPLAANDDRIIVLHPAPETPTEARPSVESVAQAALQLGRSGNPSLLCVDELFHALSSERQWAGPTTPLILREGSSQRVSIAFTTQIPQQLPTEALDLCESVSLFHLAGRSATYAAKRFELQPEVERALPTLARGEFFLVTLEGCDGVIYGPN